MHHKAMTNAATRRSPALLPGVVALVACLTVGRLAAQADLLGDCSCSLNPRYLLYRVLEPLGPYIVVTWRVGVVDVAR